MNILLIFFALPIATIIISIALQKILKCPPLVAAVIFAIFLIVTFVINNINFLVAALIYAILAFITAVIVCLICRLIERFCDNDDDSCGCGCRRNRRCNCQRDRDNSNDLLRISSNCGNSNNGDLITISSSGCNGVNNDLLTISSNCQNRNNNNCGCDNDNDNSNCGCGCNNRNGVMARINVIPNTNGNGCGQISGCYRRR